MKFDTKKIKADAKINFEETWLTTAKILPEKSTKDYLGGVGNPHQLQELIQEVRKIFLSMGFDEIENPVFIPEDEIYLQYGPEAPVILDRCYYLAGLPRPDIGLSEENIEKIKEISGIEIEKFKKILRDYRAGYVEGDNLFEEMVNQLAITPSRAADIISLFPEFKSLTPVPEKITLRSHMTAAWFSTLKAMRHKYGIPLKLFSIGVRFRREQKLDAGHLRMHYGASCVVMDDEVSLDSGKKLSEGILKKLNFKDINFVKKKATSNYYAPDTEFEIFSDDIEIADCGMYSPVAVANYDIEFPVFNIGFGLERILMLRMNINDVREALYPQFYKALELTDKDIAEDIRIEKIPGTSDGKKLAGLISEISGKHAEERSPCRFQVYEGQFLDRKIRVHVLEKEGNTKLLGPAVLNEIYVYNGNIYGIPKNPGMLDRRLAEVQERGIRVGISYLDAISNYFAYEIENFINRGETSLPLYIQIKMAKNPSDVNISIGDVARRYITSKKKTISIKGPVFMAVEVKLLD